MTGILKEVLEFLEVIMDFCVKEIIKIKTYLLIKEKIVSVIFHPTSN